MTDLSVRGVYRPNIEPDDAEALALRIGDLAAIGVCATDSCMNVDVLPKLQSLFEVIHALAERTAELAEQEKQPRAA